MDKWQMLLLGGWALEMAYLAGLAVRLYRWAHAVPDTREPVTGTLEFESGADYAKEAGAAAHGVGSSSGAVEA